MKQSVYNIIVVCLALLPAAHGASAQPPTPPSAWTPLGLSGGGAMYTPAISPADPNRMMINCDMSAAYLTSDGGVHWRMISYRQIRSSTRCRPAFHPTDKRTIYAANGDSGLKVTHDGGEHWQPIGNLPGSLRGEIAIDPGNPQAMLVGTASGIFHSTDAGQTWSPCAGPTGLPISFHFDQTSPASQRTLFAATADGIWRSRDGGAAWERKTAGLPDGPIQDFSGGSNATQGLTLLYCTVPAKEVGGKYVGGVYLSRDRGDSWQQVPGTGLNKETTAFDEWAMGPIAQYPHVLTTNARPQIVYAFNTNTGIPPPHHATAYRSDDAGSTWRATFQADPRYPGLNVEPDYVVEANGRFDPDIPSVAIDQNDPDRLITLDMSNCYVTSNGGKSWMCGHSRRAPGGSEGAHSWLCNGLVVTTAWNYYIDPFDPNRHYICYTDIGFARSLDRGASWNWWAEKGRPPWTNTCYQLAFDPSTPGLIWGAFSDTHDIPNANIIVGRHRSTYPGGVCVSTDHGATWQKSNLGLPAIAVTSVVVDPRSPKGSRVLYAGLFGRGVYKSTDNGATWSARNEGLGSDENRRVDQVYLHPDGTLFALVTAMRKNGRFQQDGVGLYRSTNGADHWELVNASKPLFWPKTFTVDPKHSKILYLSACNANDEDQCGLYRSIDGGMSWTLIGREGPEHFGAFLSPVHAGWIYMTLTEDAPGAGLWLSKDNGTTWKPLLGLPFSNVQRIAFDPSDAGRIYATTFGGSVWTGPAE
jgi:photosystem II stability/assembly factor-like uncharacterized protein